MAGPGPPGTGVALGRRDARLRNRPFGVLTFMREPQILLELTEKTDKKLTTCYEIVVS
jgi:hypothetical protein